MNKLSYILIILSTLIILYFFRKGRMPIKYTLIWLMAIFVFLIIEFFPGILVHINKFLGFQLTSNMIFTVSIMVLFFINLALTIIISGQTEKIKLLIQELSILKSEKNKD